MMRRQKKVVLTAVILFFLFLFSSTFVFIGSTNTGRVVVSNNQGTPLNMDSDIVFPDNSSIKPSQTDTSGLLQPEYPGDVIQEDLMSTILSAGIVTQQDGERYLAVLTEENLVLLDEAISVSANSALFATDSDVNSNPNIYFVDSNKQLHGIHAETASNVFSFNASTYPEREISKLFLQKGGQQDQRNVVLQSTMEVNIINATSGDETGTYKAGGEITYVLPITEDLIAVSSGKNLNIINSTANVLYNYTSEQPINSIEILNSTSTFTDLLLVAVNKRLEVVRIEKDGSMPSLQAASDIMDASIVLVKVVTLNVDTVQSEKRIFVYLNNNSAYFLNSQLNIWPSIDIELPSSSAGSASFKILQKDVNRDKYIDILFTTGTQTVYFLDGRTGEIKSLIDLSGEAQIGFILADDLNEDGFVDIVYSSGTMLYTQQSKTIFEEIYVLSSLEVSGGSPASNSTLGANRHRQGEHAVVNVTLVDIANRTVSVSNKTIAEGGVSILARHSSTDLQYSILPTEVVNSTTQFNIATGEWLVGEWNVFALYSSPSTFEQITVEDYILLNGTLSPLAEITIVSEAGINAILSSEDASYQDTFRNLRDTTQGKEIELSFTIEDNFAHVLDLSTLNISVVFNSVEQEITVDEIGKRGLVNISTDNVTYGTFTINITVNGEYILNSHQSYTVEIIPVFPTFELSIGNLLILGAIGAVAGIIFLSGIKSVLSTFDKINTTITKLRLLTWTSLVILVLLVGLMVAVTAFSLINITSPVAVFLILYITLGCFLLLFLFWFSNLIYSHLVEVDFSYRRRWLLIIVFGLMIGGLVNYVLFIAQEIPWFSYRIDSDQIDFVIFEIPTLIWTVGIASFASGFIFVITSAFYRVRGQINHLRVIEVEIKDGFYPKQKYKLQTEIADAMHHNFRELLKGFSVWYGVITASFLYYFQLYSYVALVAAVFLSALIAIFVSLVIYPSVRSLVFATFKKMTGKGQKKRRRK